LIERVETHSALLDRLLVDHKIVEDTRIGSRVTIFLTMRTQVAQFTNRLDGALYVSVREKLREQLFRASAYLRVRAADVLKELKPWDRSVSPSNHVGAVELNETRERLFRVFSEFLCESVLDNSDVPVASLRLGTFRGIPQKHGSCSRRAPHSIPQSIEIGY
jgi:hypothetical protein